MFSIESSCFSISLAGVSFRRQIIPKGFAHVFPMNSEVIPGNIRTIRGSPFFLFFVAGGFYALTRAKKASLLLVLRGTRSLASF